MQFGYLSLNDAQGIRPDVLARSVEERGFDSVWLPEHSHIPASRRTPYPNGGELPDGYYHNMDPFVSLALAAGATTTLTLATGVCLLLEHDVLALACTTASLDVLSGGRLLLGVGVGWNEEELENHRPDVPFRLRYSAMRERVAALRTAWSEDIASFEGRWDRFEPAHIYPKPVQSSIPVALGNAGKLGIRHAAEYADHWCPIDAGVLNTTGRPDVAGGIALFRDLAADAGRDPAEIPISFFAWGRPPRSRIESYAELGVDRIVVSPPSFTRHDEAETMRWLDGWADTVAELSQG